MISRFPAPAYQSTGLLAPVPCPFCVGSFSPVAENGWVIGFEHPTPCATFARSDAQTFLLAALRRRIDRARMGAA